MIIADTDVLIDFLRGEGALSKRLGEEIQTGLLRTTAVSRFELLAGARAAKEQEIILRFLGAIPGLPLDEPAADRAAQVRRDLERAGKPIGMGDSLIAGIALHHGAVLLTRNLRHFERVKGLRLA